MVGARFLTVGGEDIDKQVEKVLNDLNCKELDSWISAWSYV